MRPYWFPAALGLSITLHVFGAGWGQSAPSPVLEGAEVSGAVALGLGFEDLVKASAGAKATSAPITEPVTPDAVVAAATPTVVTASASRVSLQPSRTPMMAAKATPHDASHVDHKPAPAAEPRKITGQSVTAQTDVSKPSATRPTPRPAKQNPAPRAQKKTEPRQAKAGNAPVSARKGQATGAAQGTKAETSKNATKSTAKTAGDGAVRSYKSTVLRKIARVPKRSAGARGKAMVGITISASGVIAKVVIVTSSGHAGIDKVAMAQVKRAGPFAPPPNGKSLNVVVRFESVA
ncbi:MULTISPECIES: TonB family protein [Pacificibacter]|uniref:TonB family protein n=1 Tax=Pacificibacter TaxID=1042323 RepID=UPI001C08FA70|nr:MULTISPECIES: TonB family protein [Pacificibacter]MBU2937778.1 TonB family protein [Pacificibacter marinus]MDO6616039.1 TonB family protein [Pacificibacter sp. 1_MG-2023]